MGAILWSLALILYLSSIYINHYGRFNITQKGALGLQKLINKMQKSIIWFRIIIILFSVSISVDILIYGFTRGLLIKMIILSAGLIPFYFIILCILYLDKLTLDRARIEKDDR